MDVREITAKSILNRCGIPGIDFVVNPYIGCRFACKYCYASFMGRFVGKTVADWGEYVYAKVNAPELLRAELPKKLKNKGAGKEIFFSSVTDPYQGMEVKHQLTRACLEELIAFDFEGLVSILTKSDLVLRDINLFKKLSRVSVGLTVTSTDDGVSRFFETYAPPSSRRIEALTTLHKQGINTYAFIGPLLPHFVAQEDALDRLMEAIAASGTRDVFVEHLNLSAYIRTRLMEEMKREEHDIVETFYSSQSKEYRDELDVLVRRLLTKHDLRLILNQTIYHKEFQKKPDKAGRIV
ncbi:radical SAM protein [Candidatus Gottesmanbacteria bacterium]|nr:radical SAM protein [Candidatus Gottesmanbacteria bacterium]